MKPEVEELSHAFDHEVTQELAVSMLRPYIHERTTEASAKSSKEHLGKLIKHYLETHPGEVVWDGENGLEAKLQERDVPGRPCDLHSLFERNPGLFMQLLHNGCLRVDETALKSAGALVAGIEAYMGPKGRTTALIVALK